MKNLTLNEQKVLKALVDNGLENMGGKSPEDLLEDNFSWFYVKDITDRTSFNKHEASGYISSLAEKGMVMDDGDDDDPLAAEWYVTEKGIKTIIELLNDKNNSKDEREKNICLIDNTIGTLKQILNDFPDDTKLSFQDGDINNLRELCITSTYKQDIINGKGLILFAGSHLPKRK